MTVAELAAAALAARAALDVWFDPDSVLAEFRARTQLFHSWFWRTLFNCRFCFSFHVALWAVAALTAADFLTPTWAALVRLPVHGLACAALVHLLDRAAPPAQSGGASINGDPSDEPPDTDDDGRTVRPDPGPGPNDP